MARKQKTLLLNGIDRREAGYYSTPDFVADYLSEQMLALNPNGKRVLDPAVGREELLTIFRQPLFEVDGYDVIRHQDQFTQCYFINDDFIGTYIHHRKELEDRRYDFIVMNPPFNDDEHPYISGNKALL